MNPTLTEQLNFDVVQTELDDVFFPKFDELEELPSLATSRSGNIFKVIDTTHAAYIEMLGKGSGLIPQIGETTVLPTQTPSVRNKVTTYVLDYGTGIPLSKNFFDDNMHDVWAEFVRDFADAARVTQDYLAFKVFRGAFSTTLTSDGVSLVNASHVTISGLTVSNVGSGTVTSDNINTNVVTLMEQPNQAGVIRGNTGRILLVPPALFKVAIEETQSALVSDNANNAINFFRSEMGLEPWFSPWMSAAVPDGTGSDTAWFLLARNHSIRKLLRQGVETALTPWQYSTNRSYNYQLNFRESYYALDYSGVYGNPS